MKQLGVVRECKHPGRPHSHGRQCYRHDGCRCAAGRAYHAQSAARRRKAKALGTLKPALVNATGTRRRVQALTLQGYTASDIGRLCGMSRHSIHGIMAGRTGRVLRSHATAIAQVYEQLWNAPAPDSHGARYVRRQAFRRGYAPAMAWDDIDNDPNPADLDYYTERMSA